MQYMYAHVVYSELEISLCLRFTSELLSKHGPHSLLDIIQFTLPVGFII